MAYPSLAEVGGTGRGGNIGPEGGNWGYPNAAIPGEFPVNGAPGSLGNPDAPRQGDIPSAPERFIGTHRGDRDSSSSLRDYNRHATEATQRRFADPLQHVRFEVFFGGLNNILRNMGITDLPQVMTHKARSVNPFFPNITYSTVDDYYINQPQSFAGSKQWSQRDITITFAQTEDMVIDNIIWLLANGNDRTDFRNPFSGSVWGRKRGGYALNLNVMQYAFGGHAPLREIRFCNAFLTNVQWPNEQHTYGPGQTGNGPQITTTWRFDFPQLLS
jgi:hypothetical protein